MKSPHASLFPILSFGLISFLGSAHAASVIFSAPVTITSNADLDAPLAFGATAGSLVTAVNFYNTNASVSATSPLQTINFVRGTSANTAPPVGGNNTVAYHSAGLENNAALFNETGTTVSGGFLTVLDSQAFASANAAGLPPQTLTLAGLTIGTQYIAQFFVSDDRGGVSSPLREAFFSDGAGGTGNTSATFLESTSPYVLARFTADAATQTIYLNGTAAGSFQTSLQGYTLYTVPEPSSVALVALGGVAALGLRRRRARTN